MNITVSINPNLDRIGRAIGSLELDKVLHEILTDFAFITERYAKQVTPVDTGRLRSSIGTSFIISAGISKGGIAVVAPHTHYAGFVHEGTRYMRSRPFMLWGVEFAKDRIEKDIPLRLDKHLRQKLSRL